MSEPTKGVLLVVDDEPLKRVTLQIELSEAGYTVAEAPDAATAMQHLRSRPVDVVITDVRMPGMDGLQFLRQIKAASPKTQVILMTAFGSIDMAIEAMKRGAYDFLTKPFKTEVLLEKIERLRSSSDWPNTQAVPPTVVRLGPLVGRSYAARQLFDHIRAAADNERSILIEGETGSGAELVAQAIHELSRRANRPLTRVNCAAYSPHLLDAELFGSTSSSSAEAGTGRVQASQGGTLFLDEVDALPMDLQHKLLRLLEPRNQSGNGDVPDVRLLCATHKDLRQLVDSGKFRQDLYYRVAAVSLLIPPLRDRREDIPLLAEEYLRRQNEARNDRTVPTHISVHACEALMSYHWPGNLLELEHTLERAVTMATGDTIELKDIMLPKPAGQAQGDVWPDMEANLTSTIAGVERKLIDAALRRATGNQAKAAQFLGIPRTTLRDKMAKYGMVGAGSREVASGK
ncbi:MAG TPA: sigma-54 dependent transcriptional regulator [Phycisphaerae bacterium]|nr:sigma-54 dependent transcriptional regulator [Phycisphaerae bacterium]HOJ73450.1 sigma-54 dependent transcriptional regulator [Phycisphaerae bacterium]HOM51059.1 sigma-54 dependent transcriptional regulator [Phycisphaerae bacterium]HON67183.1 sigma-54 dependent transcriptional regulator [Phycisphaerae bacterium]HOQ86580.1 sigma-54 dependent transcriptional regulator [Phycisphaerae bacterium]